MSTESSTRKTCGPIYKEGLDRYTDGDPEKIRIFAAGFCSGQAEKVYLGACMAAMFRPSPEKRAMLLEVVQDIVQRYGLIVITIGEEIWISRPEYSTAVQEIVNLGENSPDWHVRRGLLCGVPPHEIDHKFHLRKGYGERAD